MKELPFFAILIKSWYLSHARFRFFLFGSLVALPIAGQLLLPLPHTPDTIDLIHLIASHPGYTLLFLLFYFFCILLGKSQLIPALYSALRLGNSQPTHQLPPSYLNLLKRTAFLDGILDLFLLSIAVILLFPSFVSFLLYQNIPETLIILDTFVFLPIFVLTFLIRELSIFYYLLSPLGLFLSLERGVALFIKNCLSSLSFCLFFIFLSFLFTFSLNLAMLGSVVLWQRLHFPEATATLSFIISFIGLTWYTVFSQALWLVYFVKIATEKKKGTPREEASPFEEKVSEFLSI